MNHRLFCHARESAKTVTPGDVFMLRHHWGSGNHRKPLHLVMSRNQPIPHRRRNHLFSRPVRVIAGAPCRRSPRAPACPRNHLFPLRFPPVAPPAGKALGFVGCAGYFARRRCLGSASKTICFPYVSDDVCMRLIFASNNIRIIVFSVLCVNH